MRDSLGQLKPNKVTPAMLRTFILQTRKKVKPGTVKLVVALLSSLYSDLIESEHAVINRAEAWRRRPALSYAPTTSPRTRPTSTRWPTWSACTRPSRRSRRPWASPTRSGHLRA